MLFSHFGITSLIVVTAACNGKSKTSNLKFKVNSKFSVSRQKRNVAELEVKKEKHPCDRTCLKGEAPMTCQFKYIVEYTGILSKACFNCPLNMTQCYSPDCNPGDGVERAVVTVNRELPGPGIFVCHGDRVVVEVFNKLPAATTTVHWHGMFMHNNGVKDDATAKPR